MDFSIINEFILALLAGLTQGVTEFLPISSTAHVRLVAGLLAEERDIGLTSSNIIQLGTLLAVIQYFWGDLRQFWRRLQEVVVEPDSRTQFLSTARAWLRGAQQFTGSNAETVRIDVTLTQLAVGTVPIIVLALVFGNFASSYRNLEAIALYLLAGSVLMVFGEFAHNKTEHNSEIQRTQGEYMSLGEVLLVGLFQSLAIFPGISRSGATIAGALMIGRPRAQAVRFSFLLSVPAILLAGIWDSLDYLLGFFQNPTLVPAAENWGVAVITLSFFALLLAAGAAYYSGLKCLEWLIKYLSKHSVKNFIYYRVALAVLILLLGIIGVV